MDTPRIGHDEDGIRELWDWLADDWRIQVGDDGDSNRRLNSDPVLWEFARRRERAGGSRRGLRHGLPLAAKLSDRGARVTGVDFAGRMVEIARDAHPDIDFRVDSCTELATLGDEQFDLVVANYVLMDTPDLGATLRAFARVLKPAGRPCWSSPTPASRRGVHRVGGRPQVSYRWDFPYFEPRECVDPPWEHFRTDFLWFHRPLSDYWKAFPAAGFTVVGFEEPRVTEDRYQLAENEKKLRTARPAPTRSLSSCGSPPAEVTAFRSSSGGVEIDMRILPRPGDLHVVDARPGERWSARQFRRVRCPRRRPRRRRRTRTASA